MNAIPNNSRAGEDTIASRIHLEQELPIFAAKFKSHAVAVLKDRDYPTTIMLIRDAFPDLASLPDSHIHLLSRFDQFGDLLVELRQDVWQKILPLLRVVEVSVDMPTPSQESAAPQVAGSIDNSITGLDLSDTISIHVIGGPTDLVLSIPTTSTVQQLKQMVFESLPSLPRSLKFNSEGEHLDDDSKEIHAYQITDRSIVSLATHIQVYITTPERSRVPMRATLYANVSSLKLLVSAKLEIPVYKQIMVCAGEELDDTVQLGYYPQIVHNCQIVVDRSQAPQFTQPQLSLLYPIKVKSEWADIDDDEDEGDTHMAFSTSTVLDLKVLISNLNMIVPSRQSLTFRGKYLEDGLTLSHYEIMPGDVIIMKVDSQLT